MEHTHHARRSFKAVPTSLATTTTTTPPLTCTHRHHSTSLRPTISLTDVNSYRGGHKHSKLESATASHSGIVNTTTWIERVFQKRECIRYIPDESSNDRCYCGAPASEHNRLALTRFSTSIVERDTIMKKLNGSPSLDAQVKWSIAEHTKASPTDAFGTIEFHGGPHPHKAHYIRLAFDSDSADVVCLMEKVWNLPKPKLVITIHGGVTNFRVPDKFGRHFREGLLKAAQTTGAWIITSGIDTGVVRHVAQALDEAGISARMRSQILLIGIAPWGLVRRKDKLVGMDSHVTYEHPSYSHHTRMTPVLNDRHSYFLLVDNGTTGRYGSDIVLRKRFEDYISQKLILRCGSERIPVVCVAVEGGLCTINSMLQYLTGSPPIPVVVCEGSGRASDFIAYAEKHVDSSGNLAPNHRHHLLCMVREKLSYAQTNAEEIVDRIIACVKNRDLLTVYRSNGDNTDEVDQVILRALLRSHSLSLVEKLSMTLMWNRVDMARSEVFSTGQVVPPQALYHVMLNALLYNRVDFFKLLIEQGVAIKKFLTISRLEQLYNAEPEHINRLHYLTGESSGQKSSEEAFTLPEIGEIIERLMGNAYRCHYTSRHFKSKYEKFRRRGQMVRISSLNILRGKDKEKDKQPRTQSTTSEQVEDFKYPFNDLMIWAVLTRRHEMAKCIWHHGEEALAKALVAIRLYKCMSKEAADDYTEIEMSNQLQEYAQDFRESSFELLNHCYQQDDIMTMNMLTAVLPNWGQQTCLSLAVIANNKYLLTHPSCQVLLAELWHGGLRFRSQSNFKVILAVIFPPTILLLDFKKPTYQTRPHIPTPQASEDGIGDVFPEKQHLAGRNSLSAISSIFLQNSNITNRLKKSLALPESDVLIETVDVETGDPILLRQTQSCSHRCWENCKNKFTVFYRAPITSFWIWSLSFAVFMLLYIYVLLIEFGNQVSNIEWFLLFYVVAFGLEHGRKLLQTEASSFMEQLQVFYSRYWNVLTTVATITFFIGFWFRCQESTVHSYGRIILASNAVLYHMKMYDYLSVHPRLGPYITMAGKMVVAMSYIIILLLVTLMAFGVARQSITFPHEKWSWLLVRNIFYKPYFMLYGEVYAGEIDTCGDEGTNCLPGFWIPPLLMTIFLLVANILLINMLIAIFNNIFNVTNAMSQQVWMFQRYDQVVEYQNTPIIPPPFTPIIHLVLFLKYIITRRKKHCLKRKNSSKNPANNSQNLDFNIKVYLADDELKKIHDFEEDCMDDLARQRPISLDPRLTQTIRSRDMDDDSFGELFEENTALKNELERVATSLYALECRQYELINVVKNLTTTVQESKMSKDDEKSTNSDSFPTTQSAPSLGFDTPTTTNPTDSPPSPIYVDQMLIQEKRRQRLTKKRSISLSDDIEQMQLLSAQRTLSTSSAKSSFVYTKQPSSQALRMAPTCDSEEIGGEREIGLAGLKAYDDSDDDED